MITGFIDGHNGKKGKSLGATKSFTHLRAEAQKNVEMGGWSQRAIAQALGRTQTHVNLVLRGPRDSRSLLQKIISLPPRQNIPKQSKYRKAC